VGRTLEGLPERARAELSASFPDADLEHARWLHGAFHFVALCADSFVLRVRVGADHRAAVAREHDAMRWFSQLPLPVATPRVETGTVHGAEWSAFGCTRMAGEPMEHREWRHDRAVLLPLWEALAQLDPPGPRSPAARAWCGGETWPAIVDRLTSGWADGSRQAARAAMSAVIDGRPARSVVAHGDFGPHNVLLGPSGAALIDPDNASVAEPATDLAPLLGFYPIDELSRDFSPELLERAAVIRRTLPLQVAAAAELADDASLRDHALANFLRREQRR